MKQISLKDIKSVEFVKGGNSILSEKGATLVLTTEDEKIDHITNLRGSDLPDAIAAFAKIGVKATIRS
ncbi:MAG: hypothetical protein V1835_02850 [Candidatus Micrarchaeota archaeon]